jgi:hypothetical protein
MLTNKFVPLSSAEIQAVSSPYLSDGRKLESWKIKEIQINDQSLKAMVTMDSIYPPSEDDFHLTFITAMEIVSQLQIVYMHAWAGLTVKTQEVWMIENHMRTIRPIKNRNDIQIEMKLEKMRKKNNIYFCTASHRVTDNQNGLFEIWIKALMS